MEPRKARFVARAVGASLILLSLVLPWFIGNSLFLIILGVALGGTPQGMGAQVLLIMGLSLMVVVGGVISFARRSGGVIALIGVIVLVGLTLIMTGGRALPFIGIGVTVAIVGAGIVLSSGFVARLRLRPPDDWEGTLQ